MGFFVLRPPLRPDPRSTFGPSRLGSTRERRVFDRQPPRHLPRPLVEPDGRCRRDFRAPAVLIGTPSRANTPPITLPELESAIVRTLAPAPVTNK